MMKNSLSIAVLLLAACQSGTPDLEAAQEAAAYDLIDPDSAKFREVRKVGNTVCGEVNGKNRMGAFAGFSPFYADKQDDGKWFATVIQEGFDEIWDAKCNEKDDSNRIDGPNPADQLLAAGDADQAKAILAACQGSWRHDYEGGHTVITIRGWTAIYEPTDEPDFTRDIKVQASQIAFNYSDNEVLHFKCRRNEAILSDGPNDEYSSAFKRI